ATRYEHASIPATLNALFELGASKSERPTRGGGCVGLSSCGSGQGSSRARICFAAALGRGGVAINFTLALASLKLARALVPVGVGILPTSSERGARHPQG